LASIKALKALLGPGFFLKNACCGLLCYNYGSLQSARALAKVNIKRIEDSGIPQGIPLIADCSSCAAYLKSYPQLFGEDAQWAERAQRFSRRVRDFIEAVPEQGLRRAQRLKATYHDSCRALNGQGIMAQPRGLIRRLDSTYLELPEAEVCCGGAGAFAFMHSELSDQILRRKVAHIASIQARLVAASSTSCLIQLADGLKKYYPECAVVHLSEVVAQALDIPPEISKRDYGQTART
jgi:glycolate oxidase iron-sulfur subunit